jgi:hypothetical protein
MIFINRVKDTPTDMVVVGLVVARYKPENELNTGLATRFESLFQKVNLNRLTKPLRKNG